MINLFIFLLLITSIFLALQGWYKSRLLRGIAYTFETSSALVSPNESFELITTLTNHTRLFAPYIHTREPLPNKMQLGIGYKPILSEYGGTPHLETKTYLLPKGQFSRQMRVCIPTRGWYSFSPAWLTGSDFLGMSDEMKIAPRSTEVVVFPEPVQDVNFFTAIDSYLGDVSVRRFIMDDPVLTLGCREYTGREPLKSISWAHTARVGKPMVNIHDYTAELSLSVMVCINDSFDDEASFERCLSLCHSVCKFLEQKKISYDFYSNFATMGATYMNWQYIAKGLGSRHFSKVLEGLGRAISASKEPLENMLVRAVKKGSNKGILLITNEDEPRVRREISRFHIESPLVLFGDRV